MHSDTSALSGKFPTGRQSFFRRVFDGDRGALALIALAIVLQLPLILNPGYFSHDELQWLARADTASWGAMPWSAWFNFAPFQFRPLTFNLWLVLLHLFGYQPMLMHASTIAIGIANAWMLRALLGRFGVSIVHASIATLVFLVTPYVVYVHGWVGTIGDLLTLAFLLVALLWITRSSSSATHLDGWLDGIVVAALTWLALLSKESAIVYPVLLLIAWPLRGRRMIPAVIGSALAVALYLWLRLDTILHSPHENGSYGWSLMNIPARAFVYAVYPFVPRLFEVFTMSVISSIRIIAGTIFCAAFLVVVFSAGWRWLLLLVIGFLACLGPTLILDSAANVYAYLASAFACGLIGVLYSRLRVAARAVLVVLVALVVGHGAQVGGEMRHVGRLQHHMYQSLETLLPKADLSNPIRVRALAGRDDFVVSRLLHDIPSYRRLPMEGRVIAVPFTLTNSQPTHIMLRNGEIVPAADVPSPNQ